MYHVYRPVGSYAVDDLYLGALPCGTLGGCFDGGHDLMSAALGKA